MMDFQSAHTAQHAEQDHRAVLLKASACPRAGTIAAFATVSPLAAWMVAPTQVWVSRPAGGHRGQGHPTVGWRFWAGSGSRGTRLLVRHARPVRCSCMHKGTRVAAAITDVRMVVGGPPTHRPPSLPPQVTIASKLNWDIVQLNKGKEE